MLFSKSAKLTGGSGIFFDGDPSAPADAVSISNEDAKTAINLPETHDYDFDDGALVVSSSALSVDIMQSRMWEKIKAERDRRTENGGVEVGDHWYHSDAKSRSQQHDNEAVGSGLVPVEWKTMDGSFVTMTAELAAQIRVARMASDRAIFAAAEAHRAAMEACTDPSAYNFSADWPKAYGEN